MKKITELTADLAAKQGLSQSAVNAFVTEMFALIGEGLREDDRQVKVKGLGTFKVTSVSARESVDVNTGERILIEGREKVSFVPDTVLRDRVNRPFAQFETVVLRDDVNFSEIDKAFADGTDLPAAIPEADASDETSPASAAVEAASPSESDAPAEEDGSAVAESSSSVTLEGEKDGSDVGFKEETETCTESQEETSSAGIEAPVSEDQTSSDILSDAEAVEDKTDTQVSDAAPEEPHAQKKSTNRLASMEIERTIAEGYRSSSEPVERNRAELEPEEPAERNTLALVLGIVLVIVLLGSGGGGYYLMRELSQREDSIAVLQTRLIDYEEKGNQVTASHTAAPKDHTSGAVSNRSGKENGSAKPAASVKKEKTAPAADAGTAVTESDQQRYMKDPRIRTGAYVITGVDRTVTVRKGQTIASITKIYLGAGMECYVEAVNGRKECSPGDQIKIPSLRLKKAARKK